MLAWLLCANAGCVTRGNVELLEAQLRQQEALLQSYQQDFRKLGDQLTVTRRENDILRKSLASNDRLAPEETTQKLAAVEGIRFHTMLTSGQDQDDLPGDERLHVVLYPHDADGEIVKISGDLELVAIDPSLPEAHRSLGKWTVPAENAREFWHAGFLASGYQFDVPWDRAPQGESVVLHAQLTTVDGRSFKTTHTIVVRPISEPSAPVGDTSSAPDLSPPAAQPGADAEHQTGSSVEWQDRPVPRPEPLDWSGPSPDQPAEGPAARLPMEIFRGASPIEDEPAAPSPPRGLKTSDVWTDETIPRLR